MGAVQRQCVCAAQLTAAALPALAVQVLHDWRAESKIGNLQSDCTQQVCACARCWAP